MLVTRLLPKFTSAVGCAHLLSGNVSYRLSAVIGSVFYDIVDESYVAGSVFYALYI